MEQIVAAFQKGLLRYAAIVIIGCIIFSALGLLFWFIKKTLRKQTRVTKSSAKSDERNRHEPKREIDYTHSYQHKWLLSSNEKNAFRKIKEVTDEMGLYAFTKVRLYDLLEPKANIENFKGAQWKIQSKHVDFVICNAYLDAKIVLELDDSSHQQQSRKDRDSFVDDILTNTGYTIIHANYINQEQLRQIIRDVILKTTTTT